MSAASTSVRGDTDDILGRSRAEQAESSRGALHKLVRTYDTYGLTIGRLGLGLIMLVHSSQKMFGFFGGYGFTASVGGFSKMMPPALAVFAVLLEFVSSVALVLGLLTRLGALGIIAMMVGAIALVHAPHGFFMNWFGNQQGEGFEYHLLAIALAIALLVMGGGRVSFDRILARRRPAEGGGYPTSFVAP